MLSESTKRRHALAYIRRQLAARTAKKADLERWAEEVGLVVEGTGTDGAVTKGDLLRALREAT